MSQLPEQLNQVQGAYINPLNPGENMIINQTQIGQTNQQQGTNLDQKNTESNLLLFYLIINNIKLNNYRKTSSFKERTRREKFFLFLW